MNMHAWMKKHTNIIILTMVYIATNWFLLIISGRWWDDWPIHYMDFGEMLEWYRYNGNMIVPFLTYPVKCLPEGGYRIAVFLWYYFGSLLVYKIMVNTKLFSEKTALVCTMIYIAAPINDARITMIVYNYAVTFCMFWMGFYLQIISGGYDGRKERMVRIAADILLFNSYWTESLLVYTGIIWLYLLYDEVRRGGTEKTFIRISISCVWRHLDCFLLPFVFFAFKGAFFTPYGPYEGYNGFSIASVMYVMRNSMSIIRETCLRLMDNYDLTQYGVGFIVFFVVIAGVCLYSFYEKKNGEDNPDDEGNTKKDGAMLLLGGGMSFCRIISLCGCTRLRDCVKWGRRPRFHAAWNWDCFTGVLCG